MRKAAATRARQQEERESEVDRQLEACRPRTRPASAPSGSRSVSNTPTRLAEVANVSSQEQSGASPKVGIGAYAEPPSVKMGDLSNFVKSGQMLGATRPTCGGYPVRPRKPFTSIPGYGGYIPRKMSDGIMGCTFQRGNLLARNAVLGDSLPAR